MRASRNQSATHTSINDTLDFRIPCRLGDPKPTAHNRHYVRSG
jgi:hypothetical protein